MTNTQECYDCAYDAIVAWLDDYLAKGNKLEAVQKDIQLFKDLSHFDSIVDEYEISEANQALLIQNILEAQIV